MSQYRHTITKWTVWSKWAEISYILSSSKKSKNIIIMIHGRKSSKDSFTYQEFQRVCEYQWYDSIRFDMNGHGDSYGLLNNFTIQKWVKDTNIIISFLKDLWYEKSIVFGNSVWWCVSIRAAYSNQFVSKLLLSATGNDYENYEDLYKLCKEINVPVQIIHWTHDEVIVPSISTMLHRFLINSHIAYLVWCDHWFSKQFFKIRNTVFAKALSWFYTNGSLSTSNIRKAKQKVRSILVNSNWEIWIWYLSKTNHHILIWWSIENSESIDEALHREILEETWFIFKSTCDLWTYLIQEDLYTLSSNCFLVRDIKEVSKQALTKAEIELWFEVRRYPSDISIEMIRKDMKRCTSKMWLFFSTEAIYFISQYLKSIV